MLEERTQLLTVVGAGGAGEVPPPFVDQSQPVCGRCGQVVARRVHGGGRPQRFCSDACRKAFRRSQNLASVSEGTVAVVAGSSPAGGVARRRVCDPAGPASPAPDLEGEMGGLETQIPTGHDLSWYNAKFASPSTGVSSGLQRRDLRIRLRSLVRHITHVNRCMRCGREVLGGAVGVKINSGVAHFSGLETCGSIWVCPVCQAKIRVRRGDEIAAGAAHHIASGGDVKWLTATLRHEEADTLPRTLGLIREGWRALWSGKAAVIDRRRYGSIGHIAVKEVTHGANGWHPHVHAAVMLERVITLEEHFEWWCRLRDRWDAFLVKSGWQACDPRYGLRFDFVNLSHTQALAAYIAKLQDGKGLGNEAARADLKTGRNGSRTPLQILADFGTWGNAADLELWHEYEQATRGVHAIRWSRGLKKRLLPDVVEQSDEEIAAEEVGGDTIAYLLPHTWYRICDIPGAEATILRAVEADGFAGLIGVITQLRLAADGVITPADWEGRD